MVVSEGVLWLVSICVIVAVLFVWVWRARIWQGRAWERYQVKVPLVISSSAYRVLSRSEAVSEGYQIFDELVDGLGVYKVKYADIHVCSSSKEHGLWSLRQQLDSLIFDFAEELAVSQKIMISNKES